MGSEIQKELYHEAPIYAGEMAIPISVNLI
jgi:hypothetical protein